MSEPARCESCGVLLSDHLGLTGTCKQLQEARAEIERLRAENEALREVVAAADKMRDAIVEAFPDHAGDANTMGTRACFACSGRGYQVVEEADNA